MAGVVMKRAFDLEAVRGQFPILTRQIGGKPLVYLDNAASAQKPDAVIEAMAGMMRRSYANVHRGLHTLANEATQAFEDARAEIARYLNAPAPETIVFTKGGTEAVNLVASGIGVQMGEGEAIVLSVAEHHSNIVPWHFLRERRGAVLRWVDVTEDGRLDMESYAEALGQGGVKLVALSAMSNVTGASPDLALCARMAHEAGALILFDGCQHAVHGAPDVQAMDADFYVLTGHKLYGPTGIGALYAKAEHLERLAPYQGGGEMIATVTQDDVTWADVPHKFEAGTPPIVEAAGLGAALAWYRATGPEAAHEHVERLRARLRGELDALNWAQTFGPADAEGPVVSFTVDGAHPHDIAQVLDKYGIAVRAGHHCAQPLMQRFGVTATIRASFGLYNTEAEIDAFLEALTKARSLFV